MKGEMQPLTNEEKEAMENELNGANEADITQAANDLLKKKGGKQEKSKSVKTVGSGQTPRKGSHISPN